MSLLQRYRDWRDTRVARRYGLTLEMYRLNREWMGN